MRHAEIPVETQIILDPDRCAGYGPEDPVKRRSDFSIIRCRILQSTVGFLGIINLADDHPRSGDRYEKMQDHSDA